MRITESQLRRIIREEAARVVREGYDYPGEDENDPPAAAANYFASVIKTFALVLLAGGDIESTSEQFNAIGPALDDLLEMNPELTSEDVNEMVTSIMAQAWLEEKREDDEYLDHVMAIDQDFIEPAFPAVAPKPERKTSRKTILALLKSARKAARDLRNEPPVEPAVEPPKTRSTPDRSLNETRRRGSGR